MVEQRLNDWRDWPLDLIEILRTLWTAQVEFVVIGGVAGLVHGMPLPTYDLDIMLAPGAANRRRLLTALATLDALALPDEPDKTPAPSSEQALAEGKDISFFTPHGYLDVVARPAGIRTYRELRRHAETVTVAPDVEVTVIALRDLIRSKLAAGRDRDRAKLVALQTAAELTQTAQTTGLSHPGFDGDFDGRASALLEGEVCDAEVEEVSGGVVGPRDAAGVRVGTSDRARRG